MTMLQRSLFTVALTGALLACGAASSTGGENSAPAQAPPVEPQVEAQTPAPTTDAGEGLFAIITTRLGVIKCRLDYKAAPLTVANFVGLATGKQANTAKPAGTPYYDGTIFHRVIAGFMIQGGDPTGTGAGGPGYRFPDEFDPTSALYKTGYARGAMAMANSGPNTNGSQFFIMHQNGGLPYSYSLFGQVVSGQETVDAIATTPRDGRDRPNEEVSMTVKIEAVGKEAKAFDAVKVLEANKAKFVTR
jgi:peptidyl-prolyl cis-trans isomerase A (cyclophilin A)